MSSIATILIILNKTSQVPFEASSKFLKSDKYFGLTKYPVMKHPFASWRVIARIMIASGNEE